MPFGAHMIKIMLQAFIILRNGMLFEINNRAMIKRRIKCWWIKNSSLIYLVEALILIVSAITFLQETHIGSNPYNMLHHWSFKSEISMLAIIMIHIISLQTISKGR